MSNIFKTGKQGSPILIVTDWTSPVAQQRAQHMPDNHQSYILRKFRDAGISINDCIFINPSPMMPAAANKKPPSAKAHKEWMEAYRAEFQSKFVPLATEAKVILTLGKSAAMQVFERAVAVTKVRGAFQEGKGILCPILSTLSPAHVMSRPELARDFETDLKMLAAYQAKGFRGNPAARMMGKYELVTDISSWIKDPPPALCIDTETTGLHSFRDSSIITVQMTADEGHAYVLPISRAMFPELSRQDRARIIKQIRTLLAEPRMKVFGHNLKFDLHQLALYNIKVANWWMDTLQLAFCADENMQSKALSECIRRWVPEMAGYSDAFDAKTDKSNMLACDPEELVQYGGGDTDSCFRLCKILLEEVKRDKGQWINLMKIQMPALRMFQKMEKQGMMVDQTRLRKLGVVMNHNAYELESRLLKMIPKPVKQKHFDKGLSLGRREFLQDILFSPEGFGLKATVRLADGSPATDATHLSSFSEHKFVSAYTEFQKIQKMRSTYVGLESGISAKEVRMLKSGGWPVAVTRMTNKQPEEMQRLANLETISYYDEDGDCLELQRLTEWDDKPQCLARKDSTFYIVSQSEPTGFWKHLMPDGKVHPSFFLDRTVTGRSSSKDPNFQNIPKRGALAKPYRSIFVPSIKGNVIIECDQSQAELRFAACESLDPVMLKTYRDGGDIHALTAAKVALVKLSEVTPEMRQKAKAVNFGFLYTMGPDGFVIYARSSYGVTFTKTEAEQIRAAYFALYKNLPKWHDRRRQEVRRNGFVRGLLGAKRNLPSINSSDRGVQAEAERQAINSPIQRIASDVTLLCMIQFTSGCPDWVLPLGTIHDSGVVEAPQRKAELVASWLKWCFINPPLKELFNVTLPIPLGADTAIGPDMGSMVETNVPSVKPPWIR